MIDPVLKYASYLGGRDRSGERDRGRPVVESLRDRTDFSTDFDTHGTQFGSGGVDAFVAEVSPGATQQLVFSTYLGGSHNDGGNGIALDAAGNVYMAGYTISTNYPPSSPCQTANAGSNDAVLTKLAPGGGSLVYSTYLGGTVTDIATAIAVDATGAAYVTGYTSSQNFPIGPASVQSTFGGDYDAFVTKFDPTGATHVYSTWLGGGRYDQPNGIALDASKQAYVTGQTNSTTGLSPGAPLLPAGGGHYDGFLSVLNAGGTGWCTAPSSAARPRYGMAVAVDATGAAYVAGYTSSTAAEGFR